MIKLKKIAAAAMSITMLAVMLTGCGDEESSSKSSSSSEASSESGNSSGNSDSSLDIVNFTPPEQGEDIIVMTIKGYGDVKIKLFPEEAEKGVENFKGLADKGYYDGLIFHRVIKDFMIQGGDPLGNGTGGESLWGKKFDGGTSDKLSHVAGAVAYANSGSTSTDGSQFYIVTGQTYDNASLDQLTAGYGISMSDDVKKLYTEIGGAPWLDGGYTIFGQVFDGLDIIFDIQNTATDGNDKPKEDVVIEKISVEKYNGEAVKFYMSDYK